ncbi:alpha/beta hydrolase family protein [Microbulbifer taiwanensis]|uniref:Alpha/beta hydrolase family protein n=1 Tax=Microbulbifer taiwanensis TaxID=986746 RepID=A0ABW1YQB9_9GAMM
MEEQRFSQHKQMDFEIQALLGSCYYGGADCGEILSTIDRIEAGDFEQWFLQWCSLAERIERIAHQCAGAGHSVSARQAFLRAANYFSIANLFIDGSRDPSRGAATWQRHYDCWGRFCARLVPAAEKVAIPYKSTAMPGYLFRPPSGVGPHASIIFNNGSDGSNSGMWHFGVAAALERGYAALVFDGPGQNAMLWQQGIPFRHDWERVITPVVDFLLGRGDVDPERIVISGLSQGGYWVLRALAFEQRIAAGIADPGVMDVSSSFFCHLPAEMTALLDNGDEQEFNRAMEAGLREAGREAEQNLKWRMKPYGVNSYYQLYRLVRQYKVGDLLQKIRCPMFIADPEGEQFWPGQAARVAKTLKCQKTLAPFTAREGAAWHCEPKARSLYDQRMFDWLAGVVPA